MPDWLHIMMTIVTPILAWIGGYARGRAVELRKQNAESAMRITQMIEQRKKEHRWLSQK